jgi:hypothetical protein
MGGWGGVDIGSRHYKNTGCEQIVAEIGDVFPNGVSNAPTSEKDDQR